MRHDIRTDAARIYAALHEGLQPEHLVREPLPPRPRLLVDLGPLLAVEYQKRTPRGPEPYRHAFREHARPVLAHDEHGRLHTLRGHYTVTRRGIEDMKHNDYDDGGYYGAEIQDDPYALRANPGEQTTGEFLAHGAVTAAVGGIFLLAANAALRRSGMSYAMRALTVVGVGGVAGLALSKVSPEAGMGLFVTGTLMGIQNAVAEVSMRQMLTGFQATPQPMPPLGATSTQTPNASLTLPQGTPAPSPTTQAGSTSTTTQAPGTPGTDPTMVASNGTTDTSGATSSGTSTSTTTPPNPNPAMGVENVYLLPGGNQAGRMDYRPGVPAYHYSRGR